MSESTASDFDERNNGLDIPRLDMAPQTITLFGYLYFPSDIYLFRLQQIFIISLKLFQVNVSAFYF